jgi:hypothetical protein
MEIADQGDGKAIKPFRPTRQEEILAHDVRTVRLQQDSIPGKSERASGCSPAEKLASCGKGGQKLKDACRSMRRTATPVENGPP